MKNLIVILILCIAMVMVSGCANANRKTITTTTFLPDGSKIIKTEDALKISSVGQDFKGSDLTASQEVGGTVKIKAGAVENSMSPVVVDTSKSVVETIAAIAELYKQMKEVTPTPNTP